MSMDDILNDKPEPAPEPAAQTPPEPTPAAAPEPAPAAPAPAAPEPIDETTGLTPKERGFYTKAQDEKRKRQELERRIQELESRPLPQAPTQPPPPPQEKKEFWEDPEGNLKTYEDRMRQIALQTHLNTSEQIARSKYEDFDDKIEIFKEALNRAPWLFEEAKNSPNPAEFVYKTAKNYHEIQQAGDLDTVRKNMEQELRVKLEAEYKAKEDAKRKELDEIPKSLSEVRNSGVNRPIWNGPESLDNILKG